MGGGQPKGIQVMEWSVMRRGWGVNQRGLMRWSTKVGFIVFAIFMIFKCIDIIIILSFSTLNLHY